MSSSHSNGALRTDAPCPTSLTSWPFSLNLSLSRWERGPRRPQQVLLVGIGNSTRNKLNPFASSRRLLTVPLFLWDVSNVRRTLPKP